MLKSIMRSSITTIVLFVAAAALIIGGSIGAAQAAPRIVSNDYRAEAQLTNIQVALTENGLVVEDGVGPDGKVEHALLHNLLGNDSEIVIGKPYKEVLAVRNTGSLASNGIKQYVRVTVTKYWKNNDDENEKDPSLDPSLIDLHFVEGNGWIIDDAASTDERTVLYYPLKLVQGDDTPPFADELRIDEKVLTEKSLDASGNVVYAYKDKQFEIKAVVDAVQTHNATDALQSAWGHGQEFVVIEEG